MISIIMPTYNRARVIGRAIESVLRQTYEDWELIIVDDGSSDGTERKVRAYPDSRISYFRYEVNQGAARARNLGMEKARGEYLAFLDSDNEWLSDYLETRMALLDGADRPALSFSRMWMEFLDGGRDVFPRYGSDSLGSKEGVLHCMQFSNCMDTNAVVMDRSCAGLSDGFDEGMRRLQDWEYFLRLAKLSEVHVLFEDRASVVHHEERDSLSGNRETFWSARIKIFQDNEGLMQTYGIQEEVLKHLQTSLESDFISERADFGKGVQKAIEGEGLLGKLLGEVLGRLPERVRERDAAISFYDKWLGLACPSKALGDWLAGEGFPEIGLYGYGKVGRLLAKALREAGNLPRVIIDRNAQEGEADGIKLDRELRRGMPLDVLIVSNILGNSKVARDARETYGLNAISYSELIGQMAGGE